MRHPGRRPAYPRAALLVIALLSAVLLGGVRDLACETHGLGTMRSSAVDVGGAVATAAHAMPDMAHGTGGHSHGGDGGDCACTCVGACTTVAPVAVAPAASTVRIAVVAAIPARLLDAGPQQPLPREPDRLLPFANGPPAPVPALS